MELNLRRVHLMLDQIGTLVAIAELKTASMGPINDTSHIWQHLGTIWFGILGLLTTAPQGGTLRHCKSEVAGAMSLQPKEKCWLSGSGTPLLELQSCQSMSLKETNGLTSM